MCYMRCEEKRRDVFQMHIFDRYDESFYLHALYLCSHFLAVDIKLVDREKKLLVLNF